MAGKIARANAKRKARYSAHPARLTLNTERRQKSHINALRKKLAKFERYVKAGKMVQASYEAAKERIEKEIKYTLGDLKRPAPKDKKSKASDSED